MWAYGWYLKICRRTKDGKPVVLTNLSVYDDGIATQMRNILMEHFYVMELNLSEYNELSWAYINALQTRDVIIVPGIGNTNLIMKQWVSLSLYIQIIEEEFIKFR